MKVAILLVTYNSEKFMERCFAAIDAQTVVPALIQVVDTGSKHFEYLKPFTSRSDVQFIKAERDSGFCRGNNLGVRHLPEGIDLLILLNPDCFLPSNFIERTIAFMGKHPRCGAFSCLLERYDLNKGVGTGLLDSAGIECNWYGKWFDSGQGKPVSTVKLEKPYRAKAICGALYAIRGEALREIALPTGDLFQPSFYMYKEDIELSLRLLESHWELWIDPSLVAYHCRGWSSSRKQVPRKLRLASARNECVIQWKLKRPIPIFYSTMKYLAVKGLNL
jgi:N-acetylglucosaminyl-diphospho-decaprenol L-rhamnosyltransferase